MSYLPLTQWKCDVCGQMIENMDEGYVTWSASPEGDSDFTIIHQSKDRCDDGRKHFSAALRDFLGADGLANLTAMLSHGPVTYGSGQPRIANMDEFVDFFRRVQLPHYEEARQSFKRAEVREDLSDASQVYPYLQETLQRLAS